MTPGRQIFALLLTTGGFLHIFTICFLFYYLTSFFFLPASTTNAVIATNIISTNGTARMVSAVATPYPLSVHQKPVLLPQNLP